MSCAVDGAGIPCYWAMYSTAHNAVTPESRHQVNGNPEADGQ